MRVSFLSDSNWEAKLDHALKVLDLREFFETKHYGSGLSSLVVVLNCRNPELGHKQRVRLDKTSLTLYVDVMLELAAFVRASHIQRRQMIFEQTKIQVAAVLQQRRLKNFEAGTLMSDLFSKMNEQLNGPTSTRLDQYCLEHAAGVVGG